MSSPEILNISPVLVWTMALSQLLTFGMTIWTMLTSGSKQNRQLIVQIGERMDRVERTETLHFGDVSRHIQRHDDQIAQMPSKEMMHRLELSLTRLDGHIGKIDERLKPVAAISERMQEIMIENARK